MSSIVSFWKYEMNIWNLNRVTHLNRLIINKNNLPSSRWSFSTSDPIWSLSSSEFRLFGWLGKLCWLWDRIDPCIKLGETGREPKQLALPSLSSPSTSSSSSMMIPSSFPLVALATKISFTCLACSAARTRLLCATWNEFNYISVIFQVISWLKIESRFELYKK